MGNYYNIKLFAINPNPSELNQASKTISQYQIKDFDNLVMTADFAFTYKNIEEYQNSRFKVTFNANIVQSVKPPKKV